MREIKFRGKNTSGKWCTGYYLHDGQRGRHVITDGLLDINVVVVDSIGQYTGYKDKNEKEIYEGDIVRFYQLVSSNSNIFEEPDDFIKEYVGKVIYEEAGFVVEYDGTISDFIPLNILTKEQRVTEIDESYLDYCHNLEDFPFIKNENDLLLGEVIGNVYENKDLLEE